MGTDIHFFTEVKVDGVWHQYGHPPLQRNYELFGILAGVRQEELQMFHVKGLPEDVSLLVRKQYEMEGEDAHTASYLTRQEIERFCRRWETDDLDTWVESIRGLGVGYLAHNDWYRRENFPAWVEDVRWVFWFDC